MRGFGGTIGQAWRLALPYFVSEERWSARLLLAAVLAMRLSLVGLAVVFSFWNNAFYNALQDKDWDSFTALLFLWKVTPGGILPGFCFVAALYIAVAIFRLYLTQWLIIRWRRWMTARLLDEYLAGQAYWRIGLAARSGDGYGTDNPDQRIAEDVREFISDTLSLSIGLISAVVTLASFVAILWSLSGPIEVLGMTIPGYMVWVAVAYAVAGTWLTHLVGKPLIGLRFREQRVEADFRFSLARIRENLEGIALSGGEAQEHRHLTARFAAVIANTRALMTSTKRLTALTATYDQIATVFPIVVAAPRYFSGALPLGALMQTATSFGQVQDALSWFVQSYGSIASWRATVERLAAFRAALDAARAQDDAGVRLRAGGGADIELRDVTLRLPDGRVLLDDADLVLRAGESVVVTGRSGSGKSTLFRAIAGIWPFGEGAVARPAGTLLFLPQRPYIPLGTLREAVAYPASADAYPEARITGALADCGLAHLLARLDEEDAWGQRLSGGEQQRLAIARALLAAPDWLFLDEATASLDPEGESEVYRLLRARLPGTTLVSIAHRPTVAAFHDRHIVFGEQRISSP